MVALIFLLFVVPVICLIGTVIYACVIAVDAIYDVGVSLHNNKKPVNKYRQ